MVTTGKRVLSTSMVIPTTDQSNSLMQAWLTSMQASGLAERTQGTWIATLRRASSMTGTPPELLDYETVAAFLSRPLKPHSRRGYHSALHSWFVWLIRHGHRPDDPTVLLPRPRIPHHEVRTIGTAHVTALLESGIRRKTVTMVLLGAYAGMRASEIAAMTGRSIDLIDGEIEVVGKGGVTRHVPLTQVLARQAPDYGPGYWFPNRTGSGHVSAATVSQTVAAAMHRAGIPGSCHDLRRWFATTLVSTGADLVVVQRLLGHSSLATTQKYVSTDSATRHNAVLGLPGAA